MEDREQPAFDEPPHGIASASNPRRLYAVIAVLLGVIVLLAVRPWGGDGAPPAPGGVQPTGAAAAGGTTAPEGPSEADASLPAVVQGLLETCGTPSGWRAATLQEWAGRDTPIRSWIAIVPVEATSPLDPEIPFVPVATGIVTAIGYCAPLDDAGRPPAVAAASLWAIDSGGRPVPLSLIPLEPDRPDAMGGLWSRPREITGGDQPAGVWPPGRYVVELTAPDGGYHRWLGIEIADLSLLHATPSPSIRPSPSVAPSPSSG